MPFEHFTKLVLWNILKDNVWNYPVLVQYIWMDFFDFFFVKICPRVFLGSLLTNITTILSFQTSRYSSKFNFKKSWILSRKGVGIFFELDFERKNTIHLEPSSRRKKFGDRNFGIVAQNPVLGTSQTDSLDTTKL